MWWLGPHGKGHRGGIKDRLVLAWVGSCGSIAGEIKVKYRPRRSADVWVAVRGFLLEERGIG